MAKIEGTQTIPSSIMVPYRGSLTEALPNNIVRSRYPYRVPKMQNNGRGVSVDQQTQRSRFLQAKSNFRQTAGPEKARWYAAMPRWHSLLWYYNYFMLSALDGVLGAITQGAAVIKSIQNINVSLSDGYNAVSIPTAVDPSKALLFIFGAGYDVAFATSGTDVHFLSWKVSPVVYAVGSSNFTLFFENDVGDFPSVVVQVIEYI
jgi:hypothetical protein